MPKTQADDQIRVKLSTPGDIAAAIPHLLGFEPEESLVAISLRGDRKRIGLTMRFDLPPEQFDEEVAREIAVRLDADKAEWAVLAICTAAVVDDGPPPRTALIDRIESALHARGIPLREALLIRDGRWWSYICDDPSCCPSDGTPVPDSTDIAAAHALFGRAMLPNRQALRDQLKPVESVARRAMEQAMDRVNAEMVERFLAHGYRQPCAHVVDIVRDLVARYGDPSTTSMTDDEAARVIAGAVHVPTRDLLIAAGLDLDLDVLQSLMIDVCRRAVPPFEAPPCTVLAAFAYADGNGALANVALDRALDAEPDYSLAILLRDALFRQVPPSLMRKAWRGKKKRKSVGRH